MVHTTESGTTITYYSSVIFSVTSLVFITPAEQRWAVMLTMLGELYDHPEHKRYCYA